MTAIAIKVIEITIQVRKYFLGYEKIIHKRASYMKDTIGKCNFKNEIYPEL